MSLVFGMGMLCANLLLSVGLLNKQEKVIFLPPEINRSFWVTNKGASSEYLEEMSIFLIGLMLDQTPASSAVRRKLLLRYVSPSFYNDLYQRLTRQELEITEGNISTKFSPQTIEANKDNVTLTGELSSFVADKLVSKEQASYELKFEHRGVKYLLTEFRRIIEEKP